MDTQNVNTNEEEGVSINFVSLNVRGMRDPTKRTKMFNYLKKYKGIILLQETHTQPGDEGVWENFWGKQIYLNHGTNQARGVAVIINKIEDVNVSKQDRDNQGRMILLDIEINENPYTILLISQMQINQILRSNLLIVSQKKSLGKPVTSYGEEI